MQLLNVLNPIFQICEHQKFSFIHLYFSDVEAQIFETNLLKPA